MSQESLPGCIRLIVNHSRFELAPDESTVYPLGIYTDEQGNPYSCCVARFAPGETSPAVKHPELLERWTVISGYAQMVFYNETTGDKWLLPAKQWICFEIPPDTRFQIRTIDPKTGIGTDFIVYIETYPPWSGDDCAEIVEGFWEPS